MWRLIEQMWRQFRQGKPRPLMRADLPSIRECTPWFQQLREWFNGWYVDGNPSWRFKKPHAALVGPPNAGKTSAARYLCADLRAFTPSSNPNFCLSGLNNEDYDIIIWDDFELTSCNRRLLLCLMQGDVSSIDIKCNQAYSITWQKPIIFTTNFNITDDAFNARVITINCNESCINQ